MAVHRQLAIFSAHTNLDIVQDGVNDVLAHRLGLRNLSVLQPVEVAERAKEDMKPLAGGETEFGIGRIGSLAKEGSFKSLVV